jgi:2-keto-3-deoxy-L-rhamnonate aldolase RhmA
MRANRLREIWARGETVVNGWVAIPHTFSAETMAHQGWDSLTVDMRHGVSTPKFDQDEKPMVEAIDYIVGETHTAGKIAGIHTATGYAKKMIEKGFRFVTIASDARLLAAGARAVVTEMKGAEHKPTSAVSRTY